jgi:hypothetical protein
MEAKYCLKFDLDRVMNLNMLLLENMLTLFKNKQFIVESIIMHSIVYHKLLQMIREFDI